MRNLVTDFEIVGQSDLVLKDGLEIVGQSSLVLKDGRRGGS